MYQGSGGEEKRPRGHRQQASKSCIKVRVCNKSTDTGDIRQHANPRLGPFFSVGH